MDRDVSDDVVRTLVLITGVFSRVGGIVVESAGKMELPLVEIFQTIEGEGTKAGFPTTFVRLFHCPLRCTWCDTPYSYAPARPEHVATIEEIVQQVASYPHHYVCLTGGEPLMHGEKSLRLIEALSAIEHIEDIHIETSGAIDLTSFDQLRKENPQVGKKVRFIMDYKLPASGEMKKMVLDNFSYLEEQDEVKFVIADEADFRVAVFVMRERMQKGIPLFSPVWESMSLRRLAELLLEEKLTQVRLNVQMHKVIWDPQMRGV